MVTVPQFWSKTNSISVKQKLKYDRKRLRPKP